MKIINIIKAIDPAYRIRKGYGLDILRSDRELKALIDFCNNSIADYKDAGIRGSFTRTWEKTV